MSSLISAISLIDSLGFSILEFANITVLPRKERHAGISEGDHFHENGLMVLYRHAGINRGMLFPEIFVLFLTLPLSFKYE